MRAEMKITQLPSSSSSSSSSSCAIIPTTNTHHQQCGRAQRRHSRTASCTSIIYSQVFSGIDGGVSEVLLKASTCHTDLCRRLAEPSSSSFRSSSCSPTPSICKALQASFPASWNGWGSGEWQIESTETSPESAIAETFAGLSFSARRLVKSLSSNRIDEQRNAAARIRLLTKSDGNNRNSFANAGATQPLIDLLRTEDSETQEHAVTALLNLSIDDKNKVLITEAGAIPALVKVLKVGTPRTVENAAFALFTLSCIEENKSEIVAAGAIPPLIALLVSGSLRGKKDAAIALYSLSSSKANEDKIRIVKAGVVRPLVDLMADPSSGMVEKAATILNNLAGIPEGRAALAEDGGIPGLVEMIETGTNKGKEIAASVLLLLCTNNRKHRAMVLQEGAIPPLVALSQTGNTHAKETASTLLRHLREQRNNSTGSRPSYHL